MSRSRRGWDSHTRANPYGRTSTRPMTLEDGRVLNPSLNMFAVGQLISYAKRDHVGYWTGPFMARVVSDLHSYRLKTDTGEDLLNPEVFVGTLYPEGWKTP